MSKIVVTGGTGFLGRHIVWRLCEAGHLVHFTGRNKKAADQVIALSPGLKPKWFFLDHANDNAQDILVKISSGASAIVHNAALSAPWGNDQDFFVANVASTQQVLRAVDINKIPVLTHISTPSVYFDYSDKFLVPEFSALPDPVNMYAKTKLMAEKLIHESTLNTSTTCTILRPRAIYGEWDDTLMPRLLAVMKKGTFPLFKNGKSLVDTTYVSNAVDAVILSLHRTIELGTVKTYNVSNGDPWEVKRLLDFIASNKNVDFKYKKIYWPLFKQLATAVEIYHKWFCPEKEPLVTSYSAGVLAFSQTLDISKIKTELGYAPKFSTEQGLIRALEWSKK